MEQKLKLYTEFFENLICVYCDVDRLLDYKISKCKIGHNLTFWSTGFGDIKAQFVIDAYFDCNETEKEIFANVVDTVFKTYSDKSKLTGRLLTDYLISKKLWKMIINNEVVHSRDLK